MSFIYSLEPHVPVPGCVHKKVLSLAQPCMGYRLQIVPDQISQVVGLIGFEEDL